METKKIALNEFKETEHKVSFEALLNSVMASFLIGLVFAYELK